MGVWLQGTVPLFRVVRVAVTGYLRPLFILYRGGIALDLCRQNTSLK